MLVRGSGGITISKIISPTDLSHIIKSRFKIYLALKQRQNENRYRFSGFFHNIHQCC